ncbi:hypothetical protein HK100_007071 [Physocladia obscura]|uniref:NFACT RNA-binding domain-containing protein n=1 Tax=Physocladia obscura TaxID=109957 RepID=A0AAD5SPV3_9FUNG|nr:hypothetical protein HK100_007071 [Physocladia obscura]
MASWSENGSIVLSSGVRPLDIVQTPIMTASINTELTFKLRLCWPIRAGLESAIILKFAAIKLWKTIESQLNRNQNTSHHITEPVILYMGRDKYENEQLIEHGWEQDVWFHAANLSSAHVYLRMPDGMSWDAIPEPLLVDAAQLTKANSIEGNKLDNQTIIYTPWSNLKKQAGMETGQVTFHKNNLVKKVFLRKRENDIVNRLNKTKREEYPDLLAMKVAKLRELREVQRALEKKMKLEELEKKKEYARLAELRSYKGVVDDEENMRSNRSYESGKTVKEMEEDFM